MAAKKYIKIGTGADVFEEQAGTVVSQGAGNAGDLVSLTDAGVLDLTVMPTGVGPEVVTAVASENLTAGNLINLWDNTGSINARKSDATTSGKRAHGFVLTSYTIGQTATVYRDGVNNQMSGLTIGEQWLSTSAGNCSSSRPSASGNIQQSVGIATSATTLIFKNGDTVKVA